MTLTQSSALKRIQTYGQLPTLPEVLARLLAEIEDESSSAEDLTAIITSDPAITARILRLANSAFYGSRFQIDTIQRAVVTVGFEAVKQMTLATTVMDTLSKCRQPCLDPEDFWLHALGSAKAAQLLALSTPRVSMPESCFTAGLLHGLGKYLLSVALGAEYDEVIRQAARDRASVAATERRLLETDHAEVGAWIMRQWGFPAVIVAAVRHVHAPERYNGPFQTEVGVVSVAKDLSRMAEFGDAGEAVDAALDERRLEAVGLQKTDVMEICDTLAVMRDDARTLLGLFQET